MNCPSCKSENVVKNGSMRGKKKNLCKNCGKQFTVDPRYPRISKETWALVDKLLLEKLPLAGIARVTDISEVWLQKYVNRKYAETPQEVNVKKKDRSLNHTV